VDAIVGAIILLSKVMQLEVTAEGIETREQVQYLQAFGCNLAQGFYFSCPLTPADLRGLFSKGMNLSIALEKEYNGIVNPILAA
jgi:EAL domain-containing protein (putative c-di-GMP-specific phosphodiesterase class I)